MKTTILIATALLLIAVSSLATADSKNLALTACKDHINSLPLDSARANLKRIRQKSGYIEVKMKVTTTDGRFNATCKVSNSGELTYSSNLGSMQIMAES